MEYPSLKTGIHNFSMEKDETEQLAMEKFAPLSLNDTPNP